MDNALSTGTSRFWPFRSSGTATAAAAANAMMAAITMKDVIYSSTGMRVRFRTTLKITSAPKTIRMNGAPHNKYVFGPNGGL